MTTVAAGCIMRARTHFGDTGRATARRSSSTRFPTGAHESLIEKSPELVNEKIERHFRHRDRSGQIRHAYRHRVEARRVGEVILNNLFVRASSRTPGCVAWWPGGRCQPRLSA